MPRWSAEIQAGQPASRHRPVRIGKSYQGRDIWVAKVSDNVADDEAEPEILVDALHHARERLTVEQALYLLRGPDRRATATDQTVPGARRPRETWIIFSVNPDGHVYDLGGDPYRALAQEPPADARARRTSAPTSTATTTTAGAAAAAPRGTRRPGTTAGRRPSRRPRRASCATSCRAGSSTGPADPGPRHAPHERRAGPLAVRLHEDERAVRHDARRPPRRSWPWAGRWPRATATGRCSRATSTSPTATRSTGCTAATGSSRSPGSSTRPSSRPDTDHYSPDEIIARETTRNRSALLYLLAQRRLPVRARSARRHANCGAVLRRLRGLHGLDRRTPTGTDTATDGRWQRGNPQADRPARARSSWTHDLRLARPRHGRGGRQRAPAPTTSTAG